MYSLDLERLCVTPFLCVFFFAGAEPRGWDEIYLSPPNPYPKKK